MDESEKLRVGRDCYGSVRIIDQNPDLRAFVIAAIKSDGAIKGYLGEEEVILTLENHRLRISYIN